MPVDYQKAKIYRIVNDTMPGKVYYGSTCQKLGARMASHRCMSEKKRKSYSKQLFEIGKPVIVLVENFPCNSKEELHKRERFYIENNNCVNKQIPGRTDAEYYLDNKERIDKYNKEYGEKNKEERVDYRKKNCERKKEYDKKNREKNREKIANYKKEKITCECGSTIRCDGLSEHKKSARHIKLMKPV